MEKTLTFTVEDALMSPVSFAMLSGAGIVKGVGPNDNTGTNDQKIYVHQTFDLVIETIGGQLWARLPQEVRDGVQLIATKEAPIYATVLDSAGAQKYFLSAISLKELYSHVSREAQEVTVPDPENPGQTKKETTAVVPGTEGENPAYGLPVEVQARGVLAVEPTDDIFFMIASPLNDYDIEGGDSGKRDTWREDPNKNIQAGDTVRIDCYAVYGSGAQELQIDAENFAGYYYIEASTLFRDEATGRDFPAEFIIPRGKIQSNFTFTMANSGDPSTFTFTIDAFPAYTKFNKTKKVMAALQILDPDAAKHNYADKQVIGHDDRKADHDEYYDGLYAESVEVDSETGETTSITDQRSIFAELGK